MGKGLENVGRVSELLRSWYGRKQDLLDDLVDIGLSVETVDDERITAWDEKTEDDVFYTIEISVVGSTVVVGKISAEVLE